MVARERERERMRKIEKSILFSRKLRYVVSHWLMIVGQDQPKVGEKIPRNLRLRREPERARKRKTEINFLRQKIPSRQKG